MFILLFSFAFNFNIIKTRKLKNGLEFIVMDIVNNKSKKDIRIINTYLHPKAKKEQIEEMGIYMNNVTVLVGDFNAHHESWSIGKPNTQGQDLKNFVDKNNIKILNKKSTGKLIL